MEYVFLFFVILFIVLLALYIWSVITVKKNKPVIDKMMQEAAEEKALEAKMKSELEAGRNKLGLFKVSRDKLPEVISSVINERRLSGEIFTKTQLKIMDEYDEDELRSANQQFDSLVASIEANVRSRPIVIRSKPKSAALHGGIANALAGPGAGVYTALKIDQDNRAAQESASRKLEERKKIAKEADKYYNEIESVFSKIKEIIGLHMHHEMSFIGMSAVSTKYRYKESYHKCYKYIDSSDENIRLCAQAFAWYYHKLRNLEDYREREEWYVGENF